jgi:multiple sugar transport system permease protein
MTMTNPARRPRMNTRPALLSVRSLRSMLRLPPAWTPYVLLSPFIILFLVFGLFPLLFSLYLAFHSWEPSAGLEAMQYVGFDNFTFSLQDEWFWKSLKNTLWMATASGVPQHLLAIPLACFIHAGLKRSRNAIVGAYFMPYITSTVAIAIMFTALFSTNFGLINLVLEELAQLPGLGRLLPQEPIDWTTNSDYIKPAVSIVVFWRYLGFNIVLYLAALQTIPAELYEAARMDGAGRLQQFRYITLPSLRPIMYFGVTLSVVGGLQLFEEPFILTAGNGGSDQAGMTTAIYLYRMAFDFNDFGAASAMSWLLFAVVVAMTWLTNRAFRTRVPSA